MSLLVCTATPSRRRDSNKNSDVSAWMHSDTAALQGFHENSRDVSACMHRDTVLQGCRNPARNVAGDQQHFDQAAVR